jgi:preprotein translocase subunit YajC
MIVPDYISPVIAWRVWQLTEGGIGSLNSQVWLPGKPLAARCTAPGPGGPPLRARSRRHGAAEVPAFECTCGVYAARNSSWLRRMEYDRYGIHGEVYLWGRVVEHESGWRAQFAYPKSLFLSGDRLPATLASVKARLESLITYRADIFVAGREGNILLWTATSGYQPEGLEWVIDRGQQYYERRRQERRLKPGDRVAVAGWGVAIVTGADSRQVRVVVGNRSALSVERKRVEWNEHNRRWEIPSAAVRDFESRTVESFSCRSRKADAALPKFPQAWRL